MHFLHTWKRSGLGKKLHMQETCLAPASSGLGVDMKKKQWTTASIKAWVESQTGPDYWYQTIPIKDGIVTPGTIKSTERLRLLALPDDLSGKSVLDVGCNSGMLCFECKKRKATHVVGIDMQRNRLEQARTLAEIMELDVEFKEVDLFHIAELGQFDLVFCIAVVTEVTDLIAALEVLKTVTQETLYLELATRETFPRSRRIFGINVNTLLEFNLNMLLNRFAPPRFQTPFYGTAKLRKIDSQIMTGWSLIPDQQFLDSVLGQEFEICDLGQSTRYNLFKLTKRNS
jgi:SAM-dependent methyltransferase